MEPLDTLHALRAAASGRAVRRTTYRHVHVVAEPFAITGYHLAGDPGAPLALLYGTDPTRPGMAVAAEPRDRALRFEALGTFAEALNAYVDAAERQRKQPQVLFANEATASWLLDLVAPTTQSRAPVGPYAAPPAVPIAARHMMRLRQLMLVPGSSMVLCMTGVLSYHYRTGQLAVEDLNLATQLAWIAAGPGNGPRAALRAERLAPAGPLADPHWDADYLEDFLGRWRRTKNSEAKDIVRPLLIKELREAVAEQLQPGWSGLWQAVEVMRAITAPAYVAERYSDDLGRWRNHLVSMRNETANYSPALRPDFGVQTLDLHEREQQRAEAMAATSDPLVMARSAAKGHVLDGVVTARPNALPRGRSPRPELTVLPQLPCDVQPGAELSLAEDTDVKFLVVGARRADPMEPVTVQVTGGANKAATFAHLPALGAELIASSWSPPSFYKRSYPTTVPWTHQLPVPVSEASA